MLKMFGPSSVACWSTMSFQHKHGQYYGSHAIHNEDSHARRWTTIVQNNIKNPFKSKFNSNNYDKMIPQEKKLRLNQIFFT